MVFARFCRIAPMEHMSFVPETTRWKPFFDGKSGIKNCNVTDPANCLRLQLRSRSSEPIVDNACLPQHKHSDGCNLNPSIFGLHNDTSKNGTSSQAFTPRPQRTCPAVRQARMQFNARGFNTWSGHHRHQANPFRHLADRRNDSFSQHCSRLGLSSTSSMGAQVQQKNQDDTCRHQIFLSWHREPSTDISAMLV